MESYEQERSDFWRTAGLILIGLLLGYIIGRFELTTITLSNETDNKDGNTETAQDANAPSAEEEIEISIDDDPFVGALEAPITLIEFSDYECPFCAKFHNEMLPQLEIDYIQTGKVKYVFRDFPLNIHDKAQYAHVAANCAGEQNNYWGMNNILFGKQGEWIQSEDLITTFTTYAEEIGLNSYTFSECLKEERYLDEIAKDKADGIAYGVKGTPTLFINGKVARGISTYDQLKQLLDKEL